MGMIFKDEIQVKEWITKNTDFFFKRNTKYAVIKVNPILNKDIEIEKQFLFFETLRNLQDVVRSPSNRPRNYISLTMLNKYIKGSTSTETYNDDFLIFNKLFYTTRYQNYYAPPPSLEVLLASMEDLLRLLGN